MTTECQKAKNLKALRDEYGIDIEAMVEASYQLGVLQGQCDEAFRRWDQMSLDRRWREDWLRGRLDDALSDGRKLKQAMRHMAGLMTEEHTFLRSSLLGECIEAAESFGNRNLRKRLAKMQRLLGNGHIPPKRGGPRRERVSNKVSPRRDAEMARKRKK